jgi:hypothetical protein
MDFFQAEALIQPFSANEVKLALFGMNSNISLGPDGFGPSFYKAFWDLVKPNLLSFMSDFHG